MASTGGTLSPSQPQNLESLNICSIKDFAECNDADSIPSTYHALARRTDRVDDTHSHSIPVIDFSLLTSSHPQTLQTELSRFAKACADWGFFIMINHGIPESLTQEMMSKSLEFHNLPIEYKNQFADKGLFTPIRYGTSYNVDGERARYWRDYLKSTTHPTFTFPEQPTGYKEAAYEYTRKIRDIVRVLLEKVSMSIGLEADAIEKHADFDSGFQKLQVNFYPPCPRPDLVLGLPPHTDNGFFTLLTQNGICGLQVKYEGNWVNVNNVPDNSLLVVVGDQLEAVTNGRYKGVWHRAVLSSTKTRLTLTISNGPAVDKEFGPAPQLLEKERPIFRNIKHKDYVILQRDARNGEERVLDSLRIS